MTRGLSPNNIEGTMVAAAVNGYFFGAVNGKRSCGATARSKNLAPTLVASSAAVNNNSRPALFSASSFNVKRRKNCNSVWVTSTNPSINSTSSSSSSNSSPRRRKRNNVGRQSSSSSNGGRYNQSAAAATVSSVCSYEGIRSLLVADAASTSSLVSVAIIYVVPAIVSILCYLNSLSGDFVHDDIMAVTTNQDVLGGKTSVVNLFRNDFWGKPMNDNTSHKSYRPLTILTFRMNYLIGGLEPFGFHLINVLLHSLVVVLFTCACRTCLSFWPNHVTLTAALLMASHPIHTEAIAGIVGRADVLACALSMLSFLFYTRCLEQEKLKTSTFSPPNSIYFYTSFVLASLAMLAKEHGVTVLAIIASYDFFVSEKKIRRAIKNWIGIRECYAFIVRLTITVLVTLVLITFRIWMLDGTVPQFSEQDNPTSFAVLWQARFLTYAYLLAFNAWLLLGPITMSYDWQLGSIPLVESVWDVRNLSTLFLTVTILLLLRLVLLSSQESDRRAVFLALLFVIFPFLPASNLFVTVGFVVAERILYFPSVGFCILIAHGFCKLWSLKKWRRVAVWGMAVMLTAYATKTLLRNRVWSSRESLFRSGLETLPHNAKMHYNFANLQNDLGNVQEAIKHYKETLRLWPEHASAQNNLGTLVEDALVAKFHFMEAIRINPNHARAHFNMGNLLSKESQMPAAIRFMEQAVALEPTYTDAYTNLAAMYSEVGRLDDAERVHRSLLQLEPDSADVHNNYGAFLQKIGRKDESLQSYRQSTVLQPDHVVALVNTAKLLRSMKKNVEAEEIYKRVMEMKEDPKVMDSLGVLYLSTGRYKEAKKMFSDVIKKFPEELDARVHLAQVHTHELNYPEAEEMLQWVLSRNDTHRDGLRQMALLCNHLNRTTEALDYILRALKLCSVTDVACAQLYADHATILMDRDHMDLAMESYKMALKVYPSFTLAHLNLGVIYHIKRDFTQAWSHYKTAQVLEPNNRLLQENMDKLRKAEIAFTSMSTSEHSDSCR